MTIIQKLLEEVSIRPHKAVLIEGKLMSVEDQARAFMLANDASPVVDGRVIGNGGQGGVYTLENGKVFTLPLDVARAVPPPYPKWLL